MAKLRAETVRLWGREALDLEISSERAAQIAESIDPLAGAARQARALPFDSEPADFQRAQRRWQGGGR